MKTLTDIMLQAMRENVWPTFYRNKFGDLLVNTIFDGFYMVSDRTLDVAKLEANDEDCLVVAREKLSNRQPVGDGGPAFPVTPPLDSGGNSPAGYPFPDGGMSRRDWFAGQVLPAVMASAISHNSIEGQAWPVSIDEVAEKSYRVADAMLTACNGGAS